MIEITAFFEAMGPRFSPRAVEAVTSIPFTRRNEPGDKGVSGRYRDAPMPFGWAELSDVDSGPALLESWSPLLERMRKIVQPCRDEGATSLRLHLNVEFRDQCNLEMASSFVAAVAALQVDLTITCYGAVDTPSVGAAGRSGDPV